MRYVPPFGVTDPESPYINGDPTIGRQGSIPPAAVFENPQREIVALITKSNIVPSDADLLQVAKGVRSQWLNYAEDTGSDSNLSVAMDPPLTAYTRGLVLHVRVRETNTQNFVRINAGAGSVPIRKMNGSDVGEGNLPAGALATLIYDGTVFQLSNFLGVGGAGGGDVFTVKIPYTEDISTTVGTIRANFTPPILSPTYPSLTAGDMLAVKIANTNRGPTNMIIDNGAQTAPLLPNGGGMMLQGDIHAGDVVIFFYDGSSLFFAPNPEINQWVTYTVGGAGSDFPTGSGVTPRDAFNNAMTSIKRKIIGQLGHVILQLVGGAAGAPVVFEGPLEVSHNNGDRITVRGTMAPGWAYPAWNAFSLSGNSPTHHAQDAQINVNGFRSLFFTEVRVPWITTPTRQHGIGIRNTGPGRVTFEQLLITGTRPPNETPGPWYQTGIWVDHEMQCNNIIVWGCQVGIYMTGFLACNNLTAINNSQWGIHISASHIFGGNVNTHQNGLEGLDCFSGQVSLARYSTVQNGGYGIALYTNSGATLGAGVGDGHRAVMNAGNGTNIDLFAAYVSAITANTPVTMGSSSPNENTVGNFGSTIVRTGNMPTPG